MVRYLQDLKNILNAAFKAAGFDVDVIVRASDRPDLSDFQCNDALKLAKQVGQNPRAIAEAVKTQLDSESVFISISVDGPGFLNMKMQDAWLAKYATDMLGSDRLDLMVVDHPQKTVIDYGGPNVAKPLHVGHLRSAVIGEAIKRIIRMAGNDVIGDVHFGDWGLQMGLIFAGLEEKFNALPNLSDKSVRITMQDLSEVYPAASLRSKTDDVFLEKARDYTKQLQDGDLALRGLWKYCRDVSVNAISQNYDDLNIKFDLWMGEADVHDRLIALIKNAVHSGVIVEDDGAMIINIAREDDKKNMPPVLMMKSNGSVGYHGTDIATIEQRIDELRAQRIIYLTDKRQALHFEQVFRGAEALGFVNNGVPKLEYIGFGTMNGKDGKPFKTRDGGILRLEDLIDSVKQSGLKKVKEAGVAQDASESEQEKIALQVGVAALKFADLMNPVTTDYVFDLDAFTRFDGKTGPYIQYTAVRMQSLLAKAGSTGSDTITLYNDADRALAKEILSFQEAFADAYDKLSPHIICLKAYEIASKFNAFYHHCHIMKEDDQAKRDSWLALTSLTLKTLKKFAELIGIEIPERM